MSRTQTKQIVIRMTEEDYELLKRQVEKSGMKQAEFLRQAILKKKIVSTDGMRALLPEMKRIGNNLNQIARSCNEGNQATYAEVKRQGEEMNKVWRLLRQLAQGRVSDEQ